MMTWKIGQAVESSNAGEADPQGMWSNLGYLNLGKEGVCVCVRLSISFLILVYNKCVQFR